MPRPAPRCPQRPARPPCRCAGLCSRRPRPPGEPRAPRSCPRGLPAGRRSTPAAGWASCPEAPRAPAPAVACRGEACAEPAGCREGSMAGLGQAGPGEGVPLHLTDAVPSRRRAPGLAASSLASSSLASTLRSLASSLACSAWGSPPSWLLQGVASVTGGASEVTHRGPSVTGRQDERVGGVVRSTGLSPPRGRHNQNNDLDQLLKLATALWQPPESCLQTQANTSHAECS